MNLSNRIDKLERRSSGQRSENHAHMVHVLCRGYVREVAAGTRKPEDATEAEALAAIQGQACTVGGSLAERMEAAILRGKANREAQEVCRG